MPVVFGAAFLRFLHALPDCSGRERFSDRDLPWRARNCLRGGQLPVSDELHDRAGTNRKPSGCFVSRDGAAGVLRGVVGWDLEPLAQLTDAKLRRRETVR